MKLIVSNGKYLGEKLKSFPMFEEFIPSRILVTGRNNNQFYVACGIRSFFNVLTLYVDEEYRGRGLGSLILKETINVAKKRNLNFLALVVLPNNVVALYLYYKFGFREIVRLKNYVAMMLPLNFGGELAYTFLHALCSLLPTKFLNNIARLVYRRGLFADSAS